MDWRSMTNAEREALPLGSEGWRYKRGSTIPKGQWTERLAKPDVGARGQVVTHIVWGSNGEGDARMQLRGSVKAYTPGPHVPGWHPLPAGAYLGFKSGDGTASQSVKKAKEKS